MIHISTGYNLGNIGSLIGRQAQIEITEEQIANNFVEEQAKEENTNPEDELILQKAAVAVEEVLMSLNIPEDQWPLVIQRTKIIGL